MTVVFGLSSIHSGALPRRPTAWLIFVQSSSVNLPIRTLLESTLASVHKILWLISYSLISSEKNRTGALVSIAACAAIFSPKLVFPIAGLAPTTIRLFGCSPASIRSSSENPVAVPVTSSPRSTLASI